MGSPTSTADTLHVTLPADDQILVTRVFAAPRHLIWRAWTEPDLIRRWWAGDRGQVTSIDVDLRVGGRWRYAMTANGGFPVAFSGDYRAIVPDERLVTTEVFEGAPAAPAVTTMTLQEQDGLTTVRVLLQHSSPETRDLHLRNAMADGLREALDSLEQVVAELAED